jgi:hypothetical protein
MRAALEGLGRFIATPRVAKHRVFVWLDGSVLANDGTIAFARSDDYFFGVLHSRAHELWSLRTGTSLEDRPRYTPTTCFDTFPFPFPPGQEPSDDPRVEAIAEAARELNELRERWLNPEGASDKELKKRTLTNLYNQRPTWLANAHAKLDRAVLTAYGWDDLIPTLVDGESPVTGNPSPITDPDVIPSPSSSVIPNEREEPPPDSPHADQGEPSPNVIPSEVEGSPPVPGNRSPVPSPEEDLLARLLALNLKRAKIA